MRDISSVNNSKRNRADGKTVPSLTPQGAAANSQFASESLDAIPPPKNILAKLERRNKFTPATDLQLNALINRALLHMTEEDLLTYIKNVKRFNKQPVTVVQSLPGESLIDFGSGIPVFWHALREDLKIIPKYFSIAEKLGVTPEKGVELLHSLVGSLKYDFQGPSRLIETQIKLMENCVEREIDFKSNTSKLHDFFEMARVHGEVSRALGIVQLGVAAGMSIEQSIEIVTDIYNGRGIEGYVLMGLYDQLDALGPNNVTGDYLLRALKAVHSSGGRFSAFTELLYLAVTQTAFTQNQVFEKIIGLTAPQVTEAAVSSEGNTLALTSEDEADLIERAAHELLPLATSAESEIKVAIKKPDEYFPDINAKKLVHGILPYKATKTLIEGLHDLHGLMKTELLEGAWLFDPKSDSWFSFGGRTTFQHGRVKHEFFPYDVSLLSSSPIYVHIHPENSETFIRPHQDSLRFPQLQDKATKYLAAMPSAADFEILSSLMSEASQKQMVKGLIVTSIGLTELIIPEDSQRVAEFSKSFRNLKDNVLLEFDAESYLVEHGIDEPDIVFVNRLLVNLNKKLPSPFRIVLHDFNKEIELE